jgi:uncharacterized RDD family membrane protein YckC
MSAARTRDAHRPWEADARMVQLIPPESVPIRFAIASLGARLGAQLLDLFITYGTVLLLVFVMSWLAVLSMESFFMLFVLLAFLVRIPYYILSELIWNGRTLGKRIVGIRVIDSRGWRLTPHQITARNLMKEIEVFTPASLLLGLGDLSTAGRLLTWLWVLIVLIVPLANRRRQRMGDMLAGTVVVENPRVALLPDLAIAVPGAAAGAPVYAFEASQLDVYGRYELQILEDVLRAPASESGRENIAEIVRTITGKIGYTETVQPGQEREFLRAFYRAQREHLETLRLFGKRREDKHHRAGERLAASGEASGRQGGHS